MVPVRLWEIRANRARVFAWQATAVATRSARCLEFRNKGESRSRSGREIRRQRIGLFGVSKTRVSGSQRFQACGDKEKRREGLAVPSRGEPAKNLALLGRSARKVGPRERRAWRGHGCRNARARKRDRGRRHVRQHDSAGTRVDSPRDRATEFLQCFPSPGRFRDHRRGVAVRLSPDEKKQRAYPTLAKNHCEVLRRPGKGWARRSSGFFREPHALVSPKECFTTASLTPQGSRST